MTMKANMTFQVELPDRYTVDTDHGEIRSYLRQMFNARDYGEIHSIEIVEPEEPAAEPEEPAAEPEEPAAEDLVEIPQEPPFVHLEFGDGENPGSLELLIDPEQLPPEMCGRVLHKGELHDYIIKTYGAPENRLEFFCVHDNRGGILYEGRVRRAEPAAEPEEPAAEPEEPAAEPEEPPETNRDKFPVRFLWQETRHYLQVPSGILYDIENNQVASIHPDIDKDHLSRGLDQNWRPDEFIWMNGRSYNDHVPPSRRSRREQPAAEPED